MPRKTLSFVALCLLSSFLFSQSKIVGEVLDINQEPLPYANVLLLSAADSSLVIGNVTELSGAFSLSPVSAGDYLLQFSMIGYEEEYSKTFQLADNNEEKIFGTITLKENATQLTEAQVIAKKPLFEQKIDRMVVNVATSITSAGNTALEVLQRTPGVTVNQTQGIINMAGKNGVVVMINGKENRMPVEGLVSLLQSMSADNIETIELIHTPPANFDAEGNAGFINIVLKKNLDDGFNGSLSANVGYGLKEKAGANVNFNYRKNKMNFYGDYSWSYTNNPQEFTNRRELLFDGDLYGTDAISFRDPTFLQIQNARLGLDYQISDKTVFGVLVGGLNRDWDMTARNDVYTTLNGDTTNYLSVPNSEINIWNNLLTNINLTHDLSKTQQLSFDLDYNYYFFENPSNYDYNTIEGGAIVNQERQRITKDTPMNIWVSKADYSNKLTDKITLETGLKYTATRFENNVIVENIGQGEWVVDPLFSSEVEMMEDIAAAYTSLSMPLDSRTDFKAGLRYEYTTTNLSSPAEADIVDRQYGRLFPSLFLSRKLNDHNTIQLSYSRRINRPGFMQLAPFFIFYDPTTILTGNPELQPSFADAINLNYIWKTVRLSFGYSFDDEMMANFQPDFDIENNIQFTRPRNFNFGKVYSGNISFPIQIKKWWSMRLGATGLYVQNQDSEEKSFENYEVFNWNANGNMNLKFPKNFSAEFTAFYLAPGIFGGVRNKQFARVNFGLQKQLSGNAGRLVFGVEDIFFSGIWNAFIDEPDLQYDQRYRFTERIFRLTYSRNFGSSKVKGARKRKIGSEDERRRVN